MSCPNNPDYTKLSTAELIRKAQNHSHSASGLQNELARRLEVVDENLNRNKKVKWTVSSMRAYLNLHPDDKPTISEMFEIARKVRDNHDNRIFTDFKCRFAEMLGHALSELIDDQG